MSKPEKWGRKTGKRIVSKGEYALSAVRRVAVGFGSVGLAVGAAVSFIVAFLLLVGGCVGIVYSLFHYGEWLQENISLSEALLIIGAIAGGVGIWLHRLAKAGMRKASQEDVVPLTRANTADLPAPDSLVRASEQPLQAQETVLLRAATQGQQTPPEQLVRPAGGQE